MLFSLLRARVQVANVPGLRAAGRESPPIDSGGYPPVHARHAARRVYRVVTSPRRRAGHPTWPCGKAGGRPTPYPRYASASTLYNERPAVCGNVGHAARLFGSRPRVGSHLRGGVHCGGTSLRSLLGRWQCLDVERFLTTVREATPLRPLRSAHAACTSSSTDHGSSATSRSSCWTLASSLRSDGVTASKSPSRARLTRARRGGW
jgi:hypothetical protein